MYPRVILEAGFASDPSVPIASTAWTDISAYLLAADWAYGRQYEYDRAEAGTMRLRLDNTDRRFEPEYASGPYYPNLLPLKRVRLRVGENAVSNPSLETDTSGWSVGAQFTIARSTTQWLMMTWPNVSGASLKSTFVSGSASSDMGAITVTVPVAGRYAFAAYVYVPTAWNGGVISVNAENYTGASEVVAERHDADLARRDQWQRIWRVYDIAAGDLIGDLRLRCASFPTGTPFIYTDGVQVASFDQIEPQPYVDTVRSVFTGFIGPDGWVAAYEQDWSEVAVTCVDGFEPLTNVDVLGGPNMVLGSSFETDASQWTVTRGTLVRDTTRQAAGVASGKLTCDAAIAPAEVKPAILGIAGGTYYAASCRVYIPSGLGITASDVTVGLGVTGGSEVSVAAQALFDQWQTLLVPVLFTGGGEQGTFGNTIPGNSLKARVAANNKFASKFTLDKSGVVTDVRVFMGINYEDYPIPPGQLMHAVIYSDSAGSPNALLGTSAEINVVPGSRSGEWIDFVFSPGVTLAGGIYWLGIHAGVTDNGCFFYYDQNQGSWAENADAYVDGASAVFGTPTTRTRLLSAYATFTAGVVATDGYAFVRINETGASKYIFVDEMVVREIPASAIALIDPVGADLDVALVSLRAHRLLNIAAWPVGDRAIDTGQSTIAAITADLTSQVKVLNELHNGADAELGIFFCDRDGKATLHGRARRFNPVPAAVFTDGALSPGVYPYEKPSLASTKILNDIRLTPAVGDVALASDAASRTSYGPRVHQKSLQLSSNAQATDIAGGILNRAKDPHMRFDRLTLDPVLQENAQPGLLNVALARTISDCVTVKINPPAHPGSSTEISKNVHVERIAGAIAPPVVLTLDWQLSPVDAAHYWTVEDAVYGAPDQNAVAW